MANAQQAFGEIAILVKIQVCILHEILYLIEKNRF